ncbi:MAG: DUF885 family protein [Candidatus Krumholzibacteria bacterium]|nr:DUF885 family protein [Candidatus Krumholzibacteria bacterium]
MLDRRTIITIAACLAFIPALCGCGKDERLPEGRRIYSALIAKAVETYCELHPLRSSRLGLHRSDSLLFTFSDDEITASTRRLKNLLADLSKLPVSNLEERLLDNSKLVLNWLKGELFALESINNYERNPLLYCWMTEEALYGTCSRVQPPYEGELAAYEKRMSRIPALLANAQKNLENVAEPHAKLAVERLDRLLSEFDILQELIRERYGHVDFALGPVRLSIEDFRLFIIEDLSSQTHGRLILGLENLSKIFMYDDFLELDPNRMIKEAEKSIGRLKKEANSIERKLEIAGKPAGEVVEPSVAEKPLKVLHKKQISTKQKNLQSTISHLIDEIDGKTTKHRTFGEKPAARPVVIIRKLPRYLDELPCNPYLTIPPAEEKICVLSFTPPFSGQPKLSQVVISKELEKLEETELLYRLLKASSPVRTIGLGRDEDSDSARVLISSETYREGWILFNMDDIINTMPDKKAELKFLLLGEKIRALARMIVVFRLHAGTFTSEEGAEYLASSTGLTPQEARHDVFLGSASPSIAYSGVACILNEEMLRKFSYARGVRKPRTELRRMLHDHYKMPLSMIRDRIPRD